MTWLRAELAGPLARRLGFSIFIISIFVTAFTSGVYLYGQLQTGLENIHTQLEEVKDSNLAGISARVWVADIESLKLDLAGMLNLESIEYLAVTEKEQVLVEAGKRPVSGGIARTFPIVHEYRGEPLEIGTLTVEASTADIYEKLYDTALSAIALIALQTFLVAGLVLLLVNRGVTRHLRKISAFARQLELSNIDEALVLDRQRLVSRAPDELDILADALTTMQRELKESVAALRASEENLALTLYCIGDAVIVTDCEGMVTRMNPIAVQLTGWASDDAMGVSVRDVFPIVDATTREEIESPIHRTIATGDIITLSNHTTLLAKNGEEYQIADSAAPIRNGDNIIIGAILVFHDVSEQYRMRQTLRDNEKRLKLHVEQTPLAVIEWDRDFKVTDWNPAAETMFGYRREEALGCHSSNLMVPPVVRAEVADVWQALLSNQTVVHQINENTNKDGETLVCEWFNTPLVDEDGRVVGVASLVDDITLRVRAEELNRQQQREQEQLLDNMLDAVLSVDESGTILSFNSAAAALFGHSVEEIIGKNFEQLLPADSGQQYTALLGDYLVNGNVSILGRPHEVSVMSKQGDLIPVRLSAAVLPSANDGKRRFIASFHDLSSEKKIEEQLRRSQKMDALGKLTGGIAHDYNNMLGLVLGYTELLEGELADQPKLLKYAEKIRHAGERGATLTQKLLGFSRQKPIEATAVNINSVLHDQKHMLEKILTARVDVSMNLATDLWLVLVDVGDFEDAVVNLCINAMHAMTDGGALVLKTSNVPLTVLEGRAVGLDAGEYVQLCITDSGIGMDAQTIAHIFDPFFTTKGEGGTGLGLSQVYGFVERSGGVVRVYSELGSGSRFSLYFPRYIAVTEPHEASALSETSLLRGGETILVVDDEPGLLALATEVLSREGYNVLCADSGANALTILRSQSVDLLLSDVIMPQMDGYQLAALVKMEFPKVKIQLASGFDEPSQMGQRDAQLHENLLVKPYRSRVLLERVRSMLDNNISNGFGP